MASSQTQLFRVRVLSNRSHPTLRGLDALAAPSQVLGSQFVVARNRARPPAVSLSAASACPGHFAVAVHNGSAVCVFSGSPEELPRADSVRLSSWLWLRSPATPPQIPGVLTCQYVSPVVCLHLAVSQQTKVSVTRLLVVCADGSVAVWQWLSATRSWQFFCSGNLDLTLVRAARLSSSLDLPVSAKALADSSAPPDTFVLSAVASAETGMIFWVQQIAEHAGHVVLACSTPCLSDSSQSSAASFAPRNGVDYAVISDDPALLVAQLLPTRHGVLLVSAPNAAGDVQLYCWTKMNATLSRIACLEAVKRDKPEANASATPAWRCVAAHPSSRELLAISSSGTVFLLREQNDTDTTPTPTTVMVPQHLCQLALPIDALPPGCVLSVLRQHLCLLMVDTQGVIRLLSQQDLDGAEEEEEDDEDEVGDGSHPLATKAFAMFFSLAGGVLCDVVPVGRGWRTLGAPDLLSAVSPPAPYVDLRHYARAWQSPLGFGAGGGVIWSGGVIFFSGRSVSEQLQQVAASVPSRPAGTGPALAAQMCDAWGLSMNMWKAKYMLDEAAAASASAHSDTKADVDAERKSDTAGTAAPAGPVMRDAQVGGPAPAAAWIRDFLRMFQNPALAAALLADPRYDASVAQELQDFVRQVEQVLAASSQTSGQGAAGPKAARVAFERFTTLNLVLLPLLHTYVTVLHQRMQLPSDATTGNSADAKLNVPTHPTTPPTTASAADAADGAPTIAPFLSPLGPRGVSAAADAARGSSQPKAVRSLDSRLRQAPADTLQFLQQRLGLQSLSADMTREELHRFAPSHLLFVADSSQALEPSLAPLKVQPSDQHPYFDTVCRLYDQECPELLLSFVCLVDELAPRGGAVAVASGDSSGSVLYGSALASGSLQRRALQILPDIPMQMGSLISQTQTVLQWALGQQTLVPQSAEHCYVQSFLRDVSYARDRVERRVRARCDIISSLDAADCVVQAVRVRLRVAALDRRWCQLTQRLEQLVQLERQTVTAVHLNVHEQAALELLTLLDPAGDTTASGVALSADPDVSPDHGLDHASQPDLPEQVADQLQQLRAELYFHFVSHWLRYIRPASVHTTAEAKSSAASPGLHYQDAAVEDWALPPKVLDLLPPERNSVFNFLRQVRHSIAHEQRGDGAVFVSSLIPPWEETRASAEAPGAASPANVTATHASLSMGQIRPMLSRFLQHMS